jgi:hypothetical protein
VVPAAHLCTPLKPKNKRCSNYGTGSLAKGSCEYVIHTLGHGGLSVNGLACGAAQAQSRDIDPALQLAPFVVLLDHLVKETSGSCIRVCPCWSFHLGDTGKWKNLRKFQVNGLIPLACVTVLQYISTSNDAQRYFGQRKGNK